MANLVILSGELDSDVICKHPRNKGGSFALLNLRCRNPLKGNKVDWHLIPCYGKLAESAGLHLKKGCRVLVIGQVEKSRWKTSSGWNARWQIVARAVTLDFHQWSTEWLEIALHLASQPQDSPWDAPSEERKEGDGQDVPEGV